MSQIEFYSFPHVVALGRRKMLIAPEQTEGKKRKDHEVYVRLMSGSSFTVAAPLTRKQAGKVLVKASIEMAEQTGCQFVTIDADACIPFEHVARIYVDGQEGEFVTVLEDSSGASYVAERGSEQRCRAAVEIIGSAILQYVAQKGAA